MVTEKAAKERASWRVLVVDDEPCVRLLLHQYLSRIGYAVDVASDGSYALNMIHEHRYDALILDLKMPGIDGVELYDKIKEEANSLAQRIIFVTGDATGFDGRNVITAAGNLLIEKPFDLTELERTLEIVLVNGSDKMDPSTSNRFVNSSKPRSL